MLTRKSVFLPADFFFPLPPQSGLPLQNLKFTFLKNNVCYLSLQCTFSAALLFWARFTVPISAQHIERKIHTSELL